ncbi:amidohydrolase family protein [Paenibacillus soyae]|uniref:Amidohydrolase family protein n=1 Tax=Paenibacillus soyae TaxID=2969249 RepID=A0A9X2MRU3_9BACL|nr:amidohydrolase family protein [Paenibacillus soyae]MCR2805691.1 amidohydrolase family protein [Paenibacillus soyae]
MTQPWSIRGFSNEHAHLDKGMLVPGVAYADAPPAVRGGWTREHKAKFTRQDIYDRAEAALQSMLQYGTTYIRTHVDVDPLVGLKCVEALLELQRNYEKQVIIDITAFNQEGFDRFPETAELLEEALGMGRIGLGGHTLTDADGEGHIRRLFELCERRDVPWLEFHTDESGKPEHFLMPVIARESKKRGWAGKVYAIHCNSLANVTDRQAEEAIELAAEAGLSIIVCPTAVATRAVTRTKQLMKAGLRVSLGSDNMGDLFNPLGSGNMLHYAQLLAYIQRFYEPEEQQALLDMLMSEPADAEAARRVEELGACVVYETGRADLLLAHAPRPVSMARGAALTSP